MEKQLLLDLKLYIKKNKTNDIIVREVDTKHDYIMPIKGFVIFDKAYERGASSKEEGYEDSSWLEQFRKKPIPNVAEYEDVQYSIRPVSEEEELEDYIKKEKNRETFSTKLLQYIDKTRLSDAVIYKKAGIDRRHFSKIRCDRLYKPRKATAIALCMALQLTIDEAVELLGMAGYSLSSSDTGDLIIKFCIEREIYDLVEVNEALEYFGQRLIGV